MPSRFLLRKWLGKCRCVALPDPLQAVAKCRTSAGEIREQARMSHGIQLCTV
jgi:hypothetical protein